MCGVLHGQAENEETCHAPLSVLDTKIAFKISNDFANVTLLFRFCRLLELILSEGWHRRFALTIFCRSARLIPAVRWPIILNVTTI